MIKAAIAASAESQHMDADDREDLYQWIDYIWLVKVTDANQKAEILNNFKKGDIKRMESGLSILMEREREEAKKEAQKEAKLKWAKALLDALDIDTIIKKFELTDEEVELLKLREAK